ncbi:MAG: carboxypeptidase-like regulatory domain-containing protein [Bacteroidaceae bacterium]
MNNLFTIKSIHSLRGLILLTLFFTVTRIEAQVIRVIGTVVDEKHTPMQGAKISDEKGERVLAVTDEDGKFAINVMSDGKLEASFIGYNKESVKVKGRTSLQIVLTTDAVSLGAAGVRAKRIVNKVQPEPTSIEVKGNFFHVKTRVRVPDEMFHSNSRLVVQPILHDVTKGTQTNMKPLVFDGKEYNQTQQRMYDFDLKGDSLSKYIVVRDDSTRNKKGGDILPYSDSIYVPNVKHDFTCDVFMAIENYQRLVYSDTVTIAKGTINPLRFLDYRFAANAITDSAFFPKAEVQLRDGMGEINFLFPIGKSFLDLSNPINVKELETLGKRLRAVETTDNTSLRDFHIIGSASPDGSIAINERLARARMNTSLDLILSTLSPASREKMKVSSDAKVASWTDLAELLRKDSLQAEADQVEALLRKYSGNPKHTYAYIKRLPFYDLLSKTYLPRLRKAEYNYTYTIYRELTLQEIQTLYSKDYKQLSRFEFWRLYSAQTDKKLREKMCVQAIECYPSFMMAANDLAVCRISRGQGDPDLLERFAGESAPKEVNMNHAIALLDNGRYSRADSISMYIPETENTRLLLAITHALNGKYQENYPIIAATGKRNEVLMLLAMKRNKEALIETARLPENEALTYYIRAVCQNRLDQVSEASDNLKRALELDPSLLKIAQVDGDVNDLLPKDNLELNK